LKIAAAGFLLFLLCACPVSPPLSSRQRTTDRYFGVISSIVVFDNFSSPRAVKKWNRAWEEINRLLGYLDSKLSATLPGSDIDRFNALPAGGSISIDRATREVLTLARQVFAETEGRFNPGVALLTDLWGFSPRLSRAAGRSLSEPPAAKPYDRPGGPASALPEGAYIERFLGLSDFSACILGEDRRGNPTLTKGAAGREPEGSPYTLNIDLGGIGKGYAADRCAEILKRFGYTYGLVSIGASSLFLLERYSQNQGEEWPVNILSPFDKTTAYRRALGKNEGVSTSGVYDRFYRIGGIPYSPIIDPRSGRPASGEILSATVIGGSAAYADGITTALCVMTPEEARRFIDERLGGFQVYLILADGSLISSGPRALNPPPPPG
jgi:thiamine biosynthesis lipoprotein